VQLTSSNPVALVCSYQAWNSAALHPGGNFSARHCPAPLHHTHAPRPMSVPAQHTAQMCPAEASALAARATAGSPWGAWSIEYKCAALPLAILGKARHAAHSGVRVAVVDAAGRSGLRRQHQLMLSTASADSTSLTFCVAAQPACSAPGRISRRRAWLTAAAMTRARAPSSPILTPPRQAVPAAAEGRAGSGGGALASRTKTRAPAPP
jgi:hypothetical protein